MWLHLHGNQITIQKTSDDDSKIHFIGILSRKTTSIRPIISPYLGRDTLLLEGVQISNKRRLENEDEDDIVHDQLKDADGSVTKTITMEIGFETSEEIEKWLQVTQDIIN